MNSRVLETLRLTFTGALLAGCGPGGQDTDNTGDGDTGDGDAGDGDTQISACGERPPGGGEPGAPTLTAAKFEAGRVIRLTFSEPMASVDDVDPASFRISWSFYEGYAGSGYTSYYDPTALLCSLTDACYTDYTDVVELGCAADDPTALLLRLDVFSPYICPLVDYGGLLLPHFDASLGSVRDLDGEALASISPDWVSVPDVYADLEGFFPDYPIRIPIECPG